MPLSLRTQNALRSKAMKSKNPIGSMKRMAYCRLAGQRRAILFACEDEDADNRMPVLAMDLLQCGGQGSQPIFDIDVLRTVHGNEKVPLLFDTEVASAVEASIRSA